MLISLALIITLIVLVFARDVSRSAHGAITERRSENKSFASLANGLIDQENQFDARLDRLLAHGDTLRRTTFAARLYQLNDELPGWITDADLLREPALSHHVNETLFQLTTERVAAYEALFGEIAHALTLPWTTNPIEHVADPAATIVNTSKRWNVARFALSKEPGRVRLDASTAHSAHVFQARAGPTRSRAHRSLALVRAISIVAVHVTPAPLPAPRGVLLLPPVTSVELGVSVLNASYDEQPVTLSIHVTPRTTLASRSLSACAPRSVRSRRTPSCREILTTAANERAGVVITVAGARAAVGTVTTEHYRLELSPSGNT